MKVATIFREDIEMKLPKILVPVICLGAMVLSSCSSSSGPSESEIEKSFKSALKSSSPVFTEEDNRILASIKVKKLGCKTDNASDYNCDIEVKSEKPGPGGKNAETISVPMVKGSAGWIIKGSKEWCEMLMNKPTSQLTSNDREHYQECLAYKKGK